MSALFRAALGRKSSSVMGSFMVNRLCNAKLPNNPREIHRVPLRKSNRLVGVDFGLVISSALIFSKMS